MRYIPDPMGNRMHDGVRYRKIYALEKRFDHLNDNFPQYVYTDSILNTTVQAIPYDRIKKIYYPHDYLESLSYKTRNRIENDLIELIEYITKYSKVLKLDMGISGSHMVGLNLSHSDFDIVVYGKENCYKVFNSMNKLFKDWDLPFRRYGIDDLRELYDFRGKETGIDFGNFYHFESRKILQGKFKNVDFYIRCIKAWDEINPQYGYFRYKTEGKAVIQAFITDDEESIFTPCKYRIEDFKFLQGINVDDLKEVVSFRGRCCEAKKNEAMLARGNLELVTGRNGESFHRLIVGGDKTDFLYT